ncbi:MAG: hypothetical protein K0R90_859 [Oscillospiraceae bacterium]|jgi:ABC-2 type transport system permease protein|nr:hypothetical protein [Oscillospiraceae bacterium]
MFWNIFSKRIIGTLRNKETAVWTWVFPIMMATLFFFTFTSLDTVDQLKDIPIGVIDNQSYRQDSPFQTALQSVSAKGDHQLFSLTTLSDEKEANSMLEKGEIDAYIQVDGTPKLVVKGDGLNQTIAKGFLDNYLQSKSSIEKIISNNPQAVQQISSLLDRESYTKEVSLTQNPPTDKVNYFYALLAMVCMYGGFQGLQSVSFLQANLSPLGARRTMSPTKHFPTMLSDLLGGITVHLGCVLVVVVYIIFILGINFGSKLGLVLLTCLVGSLVGVAFGAMVSVTSKLKETAKTAILTAVTLVCCFLSGLMVTGISYVVAQKAPVLSWLNPAARITDAFYCLYYYDTYSRYFLNIGILLIMSLVMFMVTAFFVRRQSYESI